MLIANPIYDSVFKYLMEDIEVAKRLITNIIGEEIIDLVLKPQEHTTRSDKFALTVFRIDFKAIVKTASGDTKKVLIELQKGKNPLDIARFRRYLGNNYIKSDEFEGNARLILPIITIYFLGFELLVESSVLKVGKTYINVSNGVEIFEKDDFIEKLTHDSYIIQIPRLPYVTQSKLEKVLSVFNQRWVRDADNKWIMVYNEIIDNPDQKLIADRLALATENEEVHDRVALEEDFELSLEETLREKERALDIAEKRAEQESQRAEQESQRAEQESQRVVQKDLEIAELLRKIAAMQKGQE
jgi:hypothetical protein